tara:strand:- start:762 stop:929 length:168 start_codon:yes stop_codon:yes gene_type:complete
VAKDLQREWLSINRLCKEVRWLSYDPDYKEIDLAAALEILEELKQKVGEKLNESR